MPGDSDFHVESFTAFVAAMMLAVNAAIGVLPADIADNLPEIVPVSKSEANLPARHYGDPTTPNAWVRSDQPGKIFVATWTDIYKKAMKGDQNAIKELAGILAHEQFHIMHGNDEGPAYEQQIKVLRQIGASHSAIDAATLAQRTVAPNYRAPKSTK